MGFAGEAVPLLDFVPLLLSLAWANRSVYIESRHLAARRPCMESGKPPGPWKLINPPVCWEMLESVNIRRSQKVP